MSLKAFLISLLIGSYAYASGTYIAPPPKPKPQIDCSKKENKMKKECKKS